MSYAKPIPPIAALFSVNDSPHLPFFPPAIIRHGHKSNWKHKDTAKKKCSKEAVIFLVRNKLGSAFLNESTSYNSGIFFFFVTFILAGRMFGENKK